MEMRKIQSEAGEKMPLPFGEIGLGSRRLYREKQNPPKSPFEKGGRGDFIRSRWPLAAIKV
jgi:hypothetical protein